MTLARRSLAAATSLLALSFIFTQPTFSQSPVAAPLSGAKTLPASVQAQISAVLGRDQQDYQAAVRPGGFAMDNPKHRLAAEFTSGRNVDRHGYQSSSDA